MHLTSLFARKNRFRSLSGYPTVAAPILLLITVLLTTQGAAQQVFQGRSQVTAAESTGGVHLPTDRSLSRAIARARERLADHEYHEVLVFLQQVLSREEDTFVERAGEEHEQLGVKATARRMIGELPPEGSDAYELLHGAAARRQLEGAIRAGDRDAIARVVRQFFHTSAGYEAAFVLAEMEADQGHRSAAAELYRELITAPRAAARFEPQLSLAAAVNLLAAGQNEEAENVVASLRKRDSATQVVIAGKPTLLPKATENAVAWLQHHVGSTTNMPVAGIEWLTLHGDPSRSSLAMGGRPLLRARWEARVVNEPATESYIANRTEEFIQRGVAVIPGARPIVVGDVVVMRTPENVVAVNSQTGKRVWETRDEDQLGAEPLISEQAGWEREQWGARGRPLDERVWNDALMSSLSSDGKRIFIVRGLTISREEETMPAWQAAALNRGPTENIAATNQLAAYDAASQGKLVWELDGSRATGKLAGAFFLGAPVAVDNTLYVMAEIHSGAIYVVAIDSRTGEVQWKQQLVELEQGIALDPARRRAGAMPSYAGGVLVCPTSASTVVAIDVVKREFAWVYRYPRDVQRANSWQLQQPQVQLLRANKDWLDSSAVISEGRVILTPPDSPEIHCLDLHSGKLKWKRRLNDALFVGGADRKNVLVVGSPSVQALSLENGAPAWAKETLPLPQDVLPTGQGFLSDGKYFLPLSSGQVAEIDIEKGNLETFGAVGSNVPLGNLISCRGAVFSQSTLVLNKFEQVDALRRRAEASLSKNENDAAALRDLAELKRAEKQKDEAIRLLKHAYELVPDDPLTQDMLVETLLEQLAEKYTSFRTDVPLLKKLIHNRDQEVELLRLDAAGLDASGDRLAAWDAYVRLAGFTADEPVQLRISEKYIVRSDRWISGKLQALWSDATPQERSEFSQKLAAERPALQSLHSAGEMRHYLAHFDQLPGSNEVRLVLANYLAEHERPLEAELNLLAVVGSRDQGAQASAREIIAKLNSKNRGHSEIVAKSWPNGRVKEELLTSPAPSPAPGERPNPPMNPNDQRPAAYRQLRLEQDFSLEDSPLQWFIAADATELVARTLLGDDVFHLGTDQYSLLRLNRDSTFVHGARLGHLLYVALGGQIVAIDSQQGRHSGAPDVLWPLQTQEAASGDVVHPRRAPLAAQVRANRRPVYHASGRKRLAGAAASALGSLGQVTPRGIVYQDDAELRCVEPLTGNVLWARTDIPAGCELFGDDDFVFAADVSSNSAYVVRFVDGEIVEKRSLPGSDWLLTAGRHLAQIGSSTNQSNTNRIQIVTVIDVMSQETLCKLELPSTARVSVIEPNCIAAFDSSGRFCVVDVAAGRLVIDEKVEAAPEMQAFYAMRSGDDIFVFVTGPFQSQFTPVNRQQPDYPIVNGPVYAFSLKSGKQLWSGPAIVRNRGLLLAQPVNLPFLVFADRRAQESTTSSSQLRVLCLDKRTGETCYRNDHVSDAAASRFRMLAENDALSIVTLDFGGAKIQLTITDQPRPPQPPANDDLEGQREFVERGLRGLGIRLGSGLRSVWEQTPGGAPPSAPRSIQLNRRGPGAKPQIPANQPDND